jgi:hypothetical protein
MDSNLSRFAGVSPQAKSRAQRGTSLKTNPKCNGRPEWIRTIDLFRVKEALWTS